MKRLANHARRRQQLRFLRRIRFLRWIIRQAKLGFLLKSMSRLIALAERLGYEDVVNFLMAAKMAVAQHGAAERISRKP